MCKSTSRRKIPRGGLHHHRGLNTERGRGGERITHTHTHTHIHWNIKVKLLYIKSNIRIIFRALQSNHMVSTHANCLFKLLWMGVDGSDLKKETPLHVLLCFTVIFIIPHGHGSVGCTMGIFCLSHFTPQLLPLHYKSVGSTDGRSRFSPVGPAGAICFYGCQPGLFQRILFLPEWKKVVENGWHKSSLQVQLTMQKENIFDCSNDRIRNSVISRLSRHTHACAHTFCFQWTMVDGRVLYLFFLLVSPSLHTLF